MSTATPLAFSADPLRSYSNVELNALLWGRFFGTAEDEVVELCVLPPSPKMTPHVAYATDPAHVAKLMVSAGAIQRGTGCYAVVNQINPAIAARYPLNTWNRADAGRAADHEILKVRKVYIDCDADRPKGISSTDVEKLAAYDLSRRVEEFLVQRLGDDRAIGRGDSGNGYSLFVAVEPFTPTKESGERVERFLKAMALKFVVHGAKIDTSVFNPARLVPAFGTLKTKGSSTADRPHRSTHFICRPNACRVPLEVLA